MNARLPFYLWLAPIRILKRTHKRRVAAETALQVCGKLGLNGKTDGELIYLALRGCQTRQPLFLNEAAHLQAEATGYGGNYVRQARNGRFVSMTPEQFRKSICAKERAA